MRIASPFLALCLRLASAAFKATCAPHQPTLSAGKIVDPLHQVRWTLQDHGDALNWTNRPPPETALPQIRTVTTVRLHDILLNIVYNRGVFPIAPELSRSNSQYPYLNVLWYTHRR